MLASVRRRLILAVGLPLLPALVGCATVFRGTSQEIDVFTDPPGAIASVGDQRITTPGTLRLPRNAKITEVRIEKDGYAPKTSILERRADGLVWLNAVSVPVGFAAGAAVGSRSGSGWFGASYEGGALGVVVAPLASFATDHGTGGTCRLIPSTIVVRLERLAATTRIRASPPGPER